MKRKQFSEEQIIGILKEAEAGAVVTELCRKHGMSSATYYAWKAKFGGLEVSDAKRLRALENENAKLKRLLAEAMLDNAWSEAGFQLFDSGFRVLNGVMENRGCDNRGIFNPTFSREYVRHAKWMIDVGRSVSILASLQSVFIGRKGRCTKD